MQHSVPPLDRRQPRGSRRWTHPTCRPEIYMTWQKTPPIRQPAHARPRSFPDRPPKSWVRPSVSWPRRRRHLAKQRLSIEAGRHPGSLRLPSRVT